MIETDIFAMLGGNASITSLVPSSQIVPVALPPGTLLPAIAYSVGSKVPLNGMSLDAQHSSRMRLTLDVFATVYLTALNIATAIHELLDGYTDCNIQLVEPLNEQDFYSSDAQVFRRSLDFYIFFNE
jgi:hypothetical protein